MIWVFKSFGEFQNRLNDLHKTNKIAFLAKIFAIWTPLLILSIFIAYGLNEKSKTMLDEQFILKDFMLFTLLGPLYETLLYQLLPLEILRLLRTPRFVQFLIAWIIFAIPHFEVSLLKGLIGGTMSGAFLVFTYVVWRKKSLIAAVGMTFSFHSIANSIVYLSDVFFN